MDNKPQILFNSTIMVRSYFGLFRDIANMYIMSTKDRLAEGFELIDQLSQDVNSTEPGAPNVIEVKRVKLLKWTATATEQMKDVIRKVSCPIVGAE